MKYVKGEEIETRYTNPPVPEYAQYKIGTLVDITDDETGKELAVFRVTYTDTIIIRGIII